MSDSPRAPVPGIAIQRQRALEIALDTHSRVPANALSDAEIVKTAALYLDFLRGKEKRDGE